MRVEHARELPLKILQHRMLTIWVFEHKGTERYHLLHEQILQSFKEIHKTASVVAQIL